MDAKNIINLLKSNIEIDDNVLLYNYINLTDEEHEFVLGFRNDLKVRKWMFNSNIINKEDHKKFVKSLKERTDQYYWVVKINESYVAGINIFQVDFHNKRCSWGYFLNPEYLGSGMGVLVEFYLLKLVFEKMRFHSLRCETLENNTNTLKIHHMFGFYQEGILRDFIFDRELKVYKNVVVSSILDREWERKKDDIYQFILKVKEMFLQ